MSTLQSAITSLPACAGPEGALSDPLVEALRARLDPRDLVSVEAVDSTWAHELVVVRAHSGSVSVYVPSPHASALDPVLGEVAGRWVCERGATIIPSHLGACAAIDDVAAWAARTIRAELAASAARAADAAPLALLAHVAQVA